METNPADDRLTDAEVAALAAADRADAAAEYASWLTPAGELTVPAEWLEPVADEFLAEVFGMPVPGSRGDRRAVGAAGVTGDAGATRAPAATGALDAADPDLAERRVDAEDLAGLAPGRELLGLLLEADRTRGDCYTTLEELAAWDRICSWAAGKVRELASLVGQDVRLELGPAAARSAGTRNTNFAGEEVAMRLGCSKLRGRNLIRTGDALRNECIPTADALASGAIDPAKAELIVGAVEHLSPDQALEVQDIVLPHAPHRPHHQVRQDLARAVAEVDHAHFTQRSQEAAKKRRVDRPRPLGDGMSSLYAVLPTLDAAAVDAALDGAARAARAAGDAHTIDQLRADFLALFGHTALATGSIEVRLPVGTDGTIAGATVVAGSGPASDGSHVAQTPPAGTATATSPSGTAAAPESADALPTRPAGGSCTLPPVLLGLVAPFDATHLMADGVVPTASAITRYIAVAERTGIPREAVINSLSPAGRAWYLDRLREQERRARTPIAPPAARTPGTGAAEPDGTRLPTSGPTDSDATGLPTSGPATPDGTRLPTSGPADSDATGLPTSGPADSDATGLPTSQPATPDATSLPTGTPRPTHAGPSIDACVPAAPPTPSYQRVDLVLLGARPSGLGTRSRPDDATAPVPGSVFGATLSARSVAAGSAASNSPDAETPLAQEIAPRDSVPGTVLHRYPLSSTAGRRARVDVTIPITALLGGDAPAYVTSLGPIPAHDARAYAAQATIRRLLTDPTSDTVLDVGTTTYRPPRGLAEHVRLRNPICVAPGCTLPAVDAELDHTVPYPRGRTAADNLGPLCRRHHLLKTHAGYRLVQPTPGVFEWTTPTGQRYRKLPDGDTFRLGRQSASTSPPVGRPDPSSERDDPPPF